MNRLGLFAAAFAALALALGAAAGVQTVPRPAEIRALIRVDAPVVVLRHVRVIDGTGSPAKDDQTIVISEGKIRAVGPASTAAPEGAMELDLSGRSVLP